jgi:uncharacterized protein (DUF1778 family)
MTSERWHKKRAARVRTKHQRAAASSDTIIRLNAEESRIFAEALLNPREPNERLWAAARRYREFIGR